MEQGKTHLDDLFAAARNDAASGSELSEPEIVRLLEHSDSLQSGSLTTNKGIWIMTSILTTGAAALIAASALIGSSDAPNTTGRIESPASASIVTSPRTSLLSTPIVPQAVAVKDSGALSGGIDPTNMLSVFAPKEIAAVKPIEITPDELSKFGVEEKEGTGLSFFIKEGAGRSAEYMNIVIPEKGWGIVMKDDQATPPPSFFEPVVVTDARGNKRLTVFSDDSTSMFAERSQVNTPTSTTVDPKLKFYTNTPNSMAVFPSATKTNDATNETEVDKMTPPIPPQLPPQIREMIENAIAQAKQNGGKNPRVMFKAMKTTTVKDSASTLAHIINDNTEMLDSFNVAIDNSDPSTTTTNEQRTIKITLNKCTSLDSSIASSTDPVKMLEKLDLTATIAEIEQKISDKLNTLVPVLVRPATTVTHNDAENRDYDNGVIMWFEPTPEFTQMIQDIHHNAPSSVEQPSLSNTTFGDPSIYPNPAHGSTTVSFHLDAPTNVAFTIHSILGEQLVNSGSKHFDAGDQTYALPLNGLAEGMYLVAITSEDGQQVIRRVVVRN